MALSIAEQRSLAEIEKHLSAEDPKLARTMARWSAAPRWHGPLELAAAAAGSLTALLVGLLTGQPASDALVAFGVVGLLAVMFAGLWALGSGGGPAAGPVGSDRPPAGRGDPEQLRLYFWFPWWC